MTPVVIEQRSLVLMSSSITGTLCFMLFIGMKKLKIISTTKLFTIFYLFGMFSYILEIFSSICLYLTTNRDNMEMFVVNVIKDLVKYTKKYEHSIGDSVERTVKEYNEVLSYNIAPFNYKAFHLIDWALFGFSEMKNNQNIPRINNYEVRVECATQTEVRAKPEPPRAPEINEAPAKNEEVLPSFKVSSDFTGESRIRRHSLSAFAVESQADSNVVRGGRSSSIHNYPSLKIPIDLSIPQSPLPPAPAPSPTNMSPTRISLESIYSQLSPLSSIAPSCHSPSAKDPPRKLPSFGAYNNSEMNFVVRYPSKSDQKVELHEEDFWASSYESAHDVKPIYYRESRRASINNDLDNRRAESIWRPETTVPRPGRRINPRVRRLESRRLRNRERAYAQTPFHTTPDRAPAMEPASFDSGIGCSGLGRLDNLWHGISSNLSATTSPSHKTANSPDNRWTSQPAGLYQYK